MDGNGRWAKNRGLARSEGHKAGVTALRRVVTAANRFGIECLSVYAFSTENWKRSESEIDGLFKLIEGFSKEAHSDFQIRFMGEKNGLPDSLLAAMQKAEKNTEGNNGVVLNIALNYGGQDEIVSACQSFLKRSSKFLISGGQDAFKGFFEKGLYTADLPPLDCIVRTGGEKRLSNFMLYQAAYAELIFLDKLWPDMAEDDLEGILIEFHSRKRKFGGET